MKAPDTYAEGRPSWVDLATGDADAAKEFYSALFGWDYDTQPSPDGGFYHMAASEGHVIAGVAKSQDPNFQAAWSTYMAVDSADATAKKAKAAGGTVLVEPMTVGPAGRMAFLADPEGAAFGVWEGHAHEGAKRINEPSAYTWAELFCGNADGVAAFYAETLGLKAEPMDFGPDAPPYTVFKVGDSVVGGMLPPPMQEVPNHWHVYFGTADADATAAAAAQAGGEVVAGPLDTPVGRMATIKDPQGAVFSAISLNEWPE